MHAYQRRLDTRFKNIQQQPISYEKNVSFENNVKIRYATGYVRLIYS